MAVSIEKIYYIAMRKYGMKLEAGKKGIWNLVSWVHVMENVEYAPFLKGEELIVLTGMDISDEDEFERYVQIVSEKGVSGIVVYLGRTIYEIPENVKAFADRAGLPVFTLPWEVKLVEFSREFGELILRSEQDEQNMCSAFRNAIFFQGKEGGYLPFFEKEGIDINKQEYCMIKCLPVIASSEEYDATKIYYDLRCHFEKIMLREQKNYVIFRDEAFITSVIRDADYEKIKSITNELQEYHDGQNIINNFCFAVSKYPLSIKELHTHYKKLTYMCKLMFKEERYRTWFWDEIGIWSIVFSLDNPQMLSEYRECNIGLLEKYDLENGTQYCRILDIYLKTNGNMQKVAEECYIHRNTVAYHLKKIEQIISVDIYDMKDKVRLYMALRIREIMEL